MIAVLTDSADPQNYWRVLKKRLKDEGNETITNCNGLKMTAPDGKKRKTDVANTVEAIEEPRYVETNAAECCRESARVLSADCGKEMERVV